MLLLNTIAAKSTGTATVESNHILAVPRASTGG